MRDQVERSLHLFATDNYGMSELIGPGVSGECKFRAGMHIAEDHFYAEIINSDTTQALPRGETGELVVTTLTKEGFPMLRYRTRDISRINYESANADAPMLEWIKSRADAMICLKSVVLTYSHHRLRVC